MTLELTTLMSHAISIKKILKVVFVKLELMTFTLQHDTLPHRNYPRTMGGQKQTNFQHHTNGHLEDTTM